MIFVWKKAKLAVWYLVYLLKPRCRKCQGTGRVYSMEGRLKMYHMRYKVCSCVKQDIELYRKAGWLS
ncbi:hypothetical protein AV654_19365 [Paenibacillus elgii]|uniref:Uncharacterized protein n=1 Tax=Paenibacillus elgii TaxID=189691 RepID=A0A163XMN4_9BACL|nr:hypothetical protein AV654_19365 [Paenibacillus elgii]